MRLHLTDQRLARRCLAWLMRERLLAGLMLLALLLACVDPRAPSAWLDWLEWPTLTGLTGLMAAIQGISDSGWTQRGAETLLPRFHSVRGVGLALVVASALLATVLTNDVSLFLMVPLTLALGHHERLPVARLVILEALAVNAGSMLSPIGNPQNLLIWQHSGLSFTAFVAAMLPATLIVFALTVLLARLWLPPRPVASGHVPMPVAHHGRGLLAVAALVGMVPAMQYGHPLIGMCGVLAAFAVGARACLRRMDWGLLLTFAVIFVTLGHLSVWPPLVHLLDHFDLDQSLSLYLAGIVGSQVISNVPATVLLLEHTHAPMALAVAVNVGGAGCVIGSLANLIAVRLARGQVTMWQFHRVAVPFLLVSAVLVYLLTSA
ncbi:MAG TPA: SLC13 family permease [Oleiagrimonas sp.]|nr:SLC13 family permease [Oleiagrimonas sp.]